MKISDLFEIDYGSAKTIVDNITDGKTLKTGRDSLFQYMKAHKILGIELAKSEIKDLDLMVTEANRMIKDPSCPHNIMNRFYKMKHKYIKKLMSMGLITKIGKAGDHYCFETAFGGRFHQLDNQFPNGLDVETVEDFPFAKPTTFDMERYREIVIQMILFINF